MQLDDYINKASHCENPMVVRNRFTGEDILVGCGHCAYCISRQSSINSLQVSVILLVALFHLDVNRGLVFI
jgi:hypothetical protein